MQTGTSMAEAQTSYEMVEVKAEDIMAERNALYAGFMRATTWGIGGVVGLLLLMLIFLV
jgi:hypothetical protein